jgi:hypothetical protein
MATDYLAQERQWLRLVVLGAIAAFVGVVALYGWLWYASERRQALLPSETASALGDTLNEATCASSRCHPALDDAPATSRHASVACVACHSQRRSHAAACVACHDRVRHHSMAAADREVARSEMERVREEMSNRHDKAADKAMADAVAAFPEPLACVTCHLKMVTRPVTFPMVALAEHLPEDKTADDCTECHRAHDPKPLLGHPIPTMECRRGRSCCLACHLEAGAIAEVEGIEPSAPVIALDLSWADPTFRDWAHESFGDKLLHPPQVSAVHGHTTVECIACHGEPPAFQSLVQRVHGFQDESVRCGKCHVGATIIDQQVLVSQREAEAGGGHRDGGGDHDHAEH